MDLSGNVDVFDWKDQATGLTVRAASYDPVLTAKLYTLASAALNAPNARHHLDKFNHQVLDQMKLGDQVREGEAPLYRWVRAMKQMNKLSFEDQEYDIPEHLAAAIVRCPGAKVFVHLLGQG